MPKYVYDFTEGNKDLKDLLGGKGANLAEMTNLGLPVPPGFTITTEACQAYLQSGDEPPELADEISTHLSALEEKMDKKLGQSDDPLLVSVRSGAKFSMPGMMETVLNIGLNDQSVRGLAAQAGNERFAFDSYRRLIQMFGKTVLDISGEHFEDALEKAKKAKGTSNDLDLDAEDMRTLVETFKQVVVDQAGRPFPQEPREQMDLAIRAVFESWNTERAVIYRRQERIPSDLGTAVNVCSMVFGNLGMDSGTGVAFTRDPASGAQGVYGDYLQNAQGEDVVAGIRNTVPLGDLEQIDKESYVELMSIMQTLEEHYRDLCDIEFTVERSKLWMLQTRVGKRTAGAAFRIATQLVDQGLIDMDEAVQRVTGAQLAQLMFPRFDEKADRRKIARGMNASPGAAVGKVVFDSRTAVKWAQSGEAVILVRRETNPDDLDGMIAAAGILTVTGRQDLARGSRRTRHGQDLRLRRGVPRGRHQAASAHRPGGVVINEGDVLSIDGTSGDVFLGEVPVVDSPVVRYFEGELDAAEVKRDELVAAVDRIMSHADEARRLGVRANADTPEDAARARRFGAHGIGLCRTEHMFLGERRELVETLILAETDEESEKALARLLPMQREDFVGIFEAMDGLPVTVRLLDPPLHEFLPDFTELSVRVAVAESRGEAVDKDQRLAAGGAPAARAEPHAGPARGSARHRHPWAVQNAGTRDPGGGSGPTPRRRQPEGGDHGAAGGQRAGAGDRQAGHPRGRPRGARRDRRRPGVPDRNDDRTAACGAHRRSDRRGRRILLLRYQRPDADHLGLLPRRRRVCVLLRLPGEGHLRGQSIRVDRRRRRRRARPHRSAEGARATA